MPYLVVTFNLKRKKVRRIMRCELFIGWRYFLTKRKGFFISLVTLISILGVAIGVAVLITVLSVMTGFGNELKNKVIGINSHLIIEKKGGIDDPARIMACAEKVEHVLAASPFIAGQAMIQGQTDVAGVVVKGIDASKERALTRIEDYLVEGVLETEQLNGIIIGRELADRLNLDLKDTCRLISPIKGEKYNFEVQAIFDSGMYEYDSSLVYISLGKAQQVFKIPGLVTGVGVKIDDLYRTNKVRRALQKALGFPYWVRTWQDLNRNLFNALKLEKRVMFIILTLIILVAAFNIASSLIMMVMEKTRDIGILKSIGLSSSGIMVIFTFEALMVGTFGTVLGLAAGLVLTRSLNTITLFLERLTGIEVFPSSVYYFDKIPTAINAGEIILIVTSAIVISLLAGIYPARQAAKLEPIKTLQYE